MKRPTCSTLGACQRFTPGVCKHHPPSGEADESHPVGVLAMMPPGAGEGRAYLSFVESSARSGPGLRVTQQLWTQRVYVRISYL